MCIICAKPAGISLPSEKTIRRMFMRNPDGAGLMYTSEGTVKIVKGLMTIQDFLDQLEVVKSKIDTKEEAMVLHFRIGTAGGNIPANTHPFPITDSLNRLRKLKCTTDIGIAHNGIINIHTRQKDISDTMEYILSQLAPLKKAVPTFYNNKHLMLMIQNAISSKMAFLLGDKTIHVIGDFIEDEGLLYSNSGFRSYSDRSFHWSRSSSNHGVYWTSGGWNDWDDEFDDYSTPYLAAPYSGTYLARDNKKANPKPLATVKLADSETEAVIDTEAMSPLDRSIYLYSGTVGHYLLSMYLDNGEYVIDEEGTMISSDDATLLIDEYNNVYVYNLKEDAAFYIDGQAYSVAGTFLKFDYTRCEYEYCKGIPLTEEELVATFEPVENADAAAEESVENAKEDNDGLLY